MVNQFTPEIMKARFWELTDMKEVLTAESAPLRAKCDALRDKLRGPIAELREAKQAVLTVERPRMGEIDTEMAIIARALGNKVGERSG